MAIFTSSPVVSPAPDNYFSQAGADQNAIKTAAGRLGVDYTQQVQPAQINMLLSSMDGIGGDPQPVPAGGQQAAVPSGQDQAGAGQSMLTGATPQSADPQTQQMVGSEAAAQGVNPDWAMRVHYAESGLAKTPFGPGTTSPAGAKGPMQLMDGTAADLGVDSSKLDQNIEGGVTYLAQMKQRYGNPVLATAAYNAGPGRVDAFLSGQGNLPHETVAYVGKVFGSDDGASLLNDALSGAHGHPIGGVPTDPTQRPGVGLEPQQSDPAAAAAVRQLVMQGRYYAAMPDGKGVRAAAAIQAQLDNIAGPGGIVDPRTGNVYRVPGSFATRFAASNAAEAGKTGPAAALYATNEGVRQAGDQRTHAANAGVDVLKAAQTPTKVSPGEILTTPAAVGVGPQAPPQMPAAPSAPAIPNPNGLLPPPGTPIGQPPRNTFTPAASSAPPA